MTSVLNVDTIADKAGTGPVALTKQSAAKAFVDYTSDTTTAVNGSASLNVASLSDGGVGLTTTNMTNAMSEANYSVPTGTLGGLTEGTKCFQNGAKTASSFSIYTTSGAGAAGDIGNTYATVHGDLA
jgi:hypothetical protein